MRPTRRAVLGGGALTLAFVLPEPAHAGTRHRDGEVFVPNAWLRIGPSGGVVFFLDKTEMGQGVMTGHVGMVAEELRVDPEDIEVRFAPPDPDYVNEILRIQLTGDSTSTRDAWIRLRQAAATARAALEGAAARRWRVKAKTCTAEGGVVRGPRGKELSFGELASDAGRRKLPKTPALRPRAHWTVLGTDLPRVDLRAKVTGEAVFGIDVERPGLLHAAVLYPPERLARPDSVDDARARAHPGVRDVVVIPRGVAVVAETWWQAHTARRLLEVTWAPGPLHDLTAAQIDAGIEERLELPGQRVAGRGSRTDVDVAAEVEATYQLPYLAHATMEPQNCTAHVTDSGCTIWAPTQSVAMAQQAAAGALGLKRSEVEVHATFVGGGFGRRIPQDVVVDCVQIAVQVDAPVKLTFSREDDIKIDFFRQRCAARLRGGLDASGHPVSWFQRVVGPSVLGWIGDEFFATAAPPFLPPRTRARLAANFAAKGAKGEGDVSSIAGGAEEIPYALPHLEVELHTWDPGVPVGYWRSVGHSANAFAIECFLDELAEAGGKDPGALRLELLAHSPRRRRALRAALDHAAWRDPWPEGISKGVAQHSSFESHVAMVVDITVADGVLDLLRVTCAVDCGMVLNPDIVRAQVESGVAFGLSAAMGQRIDVDRGRVRQSNFHDFPVLRMSAMPEVEVVILESEDEPGGVGEIAVPPVAPALCNAIFSATGRRIRTLPIGEQLS